MRRLTSFDPRLVELRRALVSMVAVLLSFACASALRSLFDLGIDVAVLAVVLALMLGRSKPVGLRRLGVEAIQLMVTSVAASFVGRMFVTHPNWADACFVAALTLSVWLRRYGTRLGSVASLVSLPMIAALVAPVPQPPGGHFALWAALVALIALALVNVTRLVAACLGIIPPLVFEKAHSQGFNVEKPKPISKRRVSANTRLAVQMAVTLSIAFVIGRRFYGSHWPWLVLTGYIVATGNRGRADVIYKGALRVVGAAVGTLIATLLSGVVSPGNKWAVVAIFVVIGVATWLRTFNYAFWAGLVTAALALLYGYFGQNGLTQLDERLGAVVVGGLLAVGVSWFVLPLRTTDVLRRRTADLLAALNQFLLALGGDDDKARVEKALLALLKAEAGLDEIRPPLHAWRWVGRGRGHHGSTANRIDALKRCVDEARQFWELAAPEPALLRSDSTKAAIKALLYNLGMVRRQLRDGQAPDFVALPSAGEALSGHLEGMNAQLVISTGTEPV